MDQDRPSKLSSSNFFFIWFLLTFVIPFNFCFWLIYISYKGGLGMDVFVVEPMIFVYLIFLIVFQIVQIYRLKKYHYGKPNIFIYLIVLALIVIPGIFTVSYSIKTDNELAARAAIDLKNSTEHCQSERAILENVIQSDYVKELQAYTEYNDGIISFQLPVGFVPVVGVKNTDSNSEQKNNNDKFSQPEDWPKEKTTHMITLYRDNAMITLQKHETSLREHQVPNIELPSQRSDNNIFKINNIFIRSDDETSFDVSSNSVGFDPNNYIEFIIGRSCNNNGSLSLASDDNLKMFDQIKQTVKLVK